MFSHRVSQTIRSFDPAFAKANSPSPPPRATTVKPTTSTTPPPQNTPRPDPTSPSTPTPATAVSNPGSNPTSDSTTTSPTNPDSGTSTSTGTDTGTATGTNTDTNTGSGKSSDSVSTANRGSNGSAGQATGSPGLQQSGVNAAYSTDTLTGPGHSRVDSQPTDSSGNPIDSVSGSKKGNAGAIAGGVIGGLLFFAIMCGLAYWLIMRRRRRSHMAPSAAYMAAYGSNRPDTSMSSRPLADRSASVLDLTHGHAERHSPYRVS